MTLTIIVWTHALTALLFGGLAFWTIRSKEHGLPRAPLAAAFAITALWALAVAGIGSGDFVTQMVEALRNLAWLFAMLIIHRRDGNVRPPVALGTVYGVVGLVILANLGARVANEVAGGVADGKFENTAILLQLLAAVAALVLLNALFAALLPRAGKRMIVLAIGGIWAADTILFGTAYLGGTWRMEPVAVRGVAMMAVAAAMGTGLQRKGEWGVQVSRTVAYQSLSLVAIGGYLLFLALATSAIATVGGSHARILQTAFVLGSTAAILTLVSNSWLRAWIKVKLAKHFFRHRYDYRSEWMRFTDTLGSSEAAPLEERIVKALADLTDSPAGLLLVPDGGTLVPASSWNWDQDVIPGDDDGTLVHHLQHTGRIVDLDALRISGEGSADAQAVPHWLLASANAWVLVPLPHLGQLAGAILLARPPLPRALDWEDLDLLKVAGRQVASYLAEARAQEALAEAQRFDEFNRRFAFILHDIKNLVSQLTLTARNAERHADKPEFRADMIATLQESAERMNALLARLSQHHRSRTEPPQPVDVVPLVERVASRRKGQHPVAIVAAPAAVAIADPMSLEQVLAHLLQNAIEASAPTDPVTLAIGTESGSVVIDVIDEGCGMSQGFIRDRLFKPFVSSKSGGFGIGAFEARQLAAAMGATLEVTSREGVGSRFRVKLRGAQTSAAQMEQAA
ncbi:XrtA/PEP-CTERM system histidine kinase PrsK [Sphingomonas sp. S2-65]|uniref:XrtA/PEP-CTERM system histidine kinase PrsK n=1 Tax=Sphingomonas sp. S2-65 TaxID=2903960 RepID=UPI001F3E5AD7|nr:XrtA/PEP-CTERM system histidine kinase PrsK [Sphingomonas sp. S2-65]UYY57797.1 PEP-CTERM system histidine kinase PrsK [Sphingomonas sp. S2-65]